MISVLVFPLTSFIAAVFNGSETDSIMAILQVWGGWNAGWFSIFYLVPIAFGMCGKEQAMNLYDEITKNAASEGQ